MVLTKNDTLALKGIAILLLLWHHMFLCRRIYFLIGMILV